MNEELLDGCRRGDQGAWSMLVERYERLVYTIAVRLGLNSDEAGDVSQATFAALLTGLGGITDPERLGAWLSTVARREAIKVIERRERDRRLHTDIHNRAELHDYADADAESALADIEWVHQGLARLGDRCRRVLEELFMSPASPRSPASASAAGATIDGEGAIHLGHDDSIDAGASHHAIDGGPAGDHATDDGGSSGQASRLYEAAAIRLGIPVGSLGPTRRRCLDALHDALIELASGAERS